MLFIALLALLITVALSCSLRQASDVPYSREHLAATHDSDRCNIPVLTLCSDVPAHFPRSPFILRSLKNRTRFTALTTPAALLDRLASSPITLASANTYSHTRRTQPFDEYLATITTTPVSLADTANNTFYWFGDHGKCAVLTTSVSQPQQIAAQRSRAWSSDNRCVLLMSVCCICVLLTDDPATSSSPLAELLAQYAVPGVYYGLDECGGAGHDILDQPVSRYEMRLSFGIGGQYSGTPFHYHSSVFAHVLHGRKRWLLHPPTQLPPPAIVQPHMSAIQWMDEMWLGGGADTSVRNIVLECVCEAGDVLYLPDGWLHMTLNMDAYNVFVSSFVYDKGEDWKERHREWTSKYGALQY